ncbi:MAG: hypothetical protein JST73_12065 [Actinobacteria bacterium]|nr:hypothetical protein [Actinomycetota bacterium]
MTIATLTSQDVAVLVAVGVSLAATVVVTIVVVLLVQTLRTLRRELTEFRECSHGLLDELADTVDDARHDLERVDDLIGSAEALAATVDGVAKVGYLTVGKPVIKTVALAKGTSRAARRIRGTGTG